jgi:transcriptional regulator with XRE-family HTH domain
MCDYVTGTQKEVNDYFCVLMTFCDNKRTMDIGKRLALIRTKNGVSQEALSEITGISRGHITKMENDKVSPTVQTLENYLAACGSTLTELFESKTPLDYANKEHQGLHEKLQAILDADAEFAPGVTLTIDSIYSHVLKTLAGKREDVTAKRGDRVDITHKRRPK